MLYLHFLVPVKGLVPYYSKLDIKSDQLDEYVVVNFLCESIESELSCLEHIVTVPGITFLVGGEAFIVGGESRFKTCNEHLKSEEGRFYDKISYSIPFFKVPHFCI